MKVLVIGSGGREHALAWKLKQSKRVTEIFCAPGNAGTGRLGRNIPIPANDLDDLVKFAVEERIDLTVVGPDDALAAGVVDLFQQNGLRIFGPAKAAAQLESSKSFAKDFMERHGIPTAAAGRFEKSEEAHAFCQGKHYPLVVKADGLALGKGVVIARNPFEAANAIYAMMERKRFGEAGRRVLIEEFLVGTECSIHALVDGRNYVMFPSAQDHKRAFDGDEGPNTGGMGTLSPTPVFTPEIAQRVEREIMQPFIAGLQRDALDFRGLLFPGLMITADGPKVLEFNCRFGDPETQVLLPRLQSDLVEALEATIDARLDRLSLTWDHRPAVCVVMASGGYPEAYEKGKAISGLDQLDSAADVVVFHAGTTRADGRVVTSGGRVLGVTAMGENVASARHSAYAAVSRIQFERAQFRTDIALRAATS